MLLNPVEEEEFRRWEIVLRKLYDVTVALQGDSVTLSVARVLLDGIARLDIPFADASFHIAKDANIVRCIDLECGIVKVLNGEEHLLNGREKRYLNPFRLEEPSTCQVASQSGNVAIDLLNSNKKRRMVTAEGSIRGSCPRSRFVDSRPSFESFRHHGLACQAYPRRYQVPIPRPWTKYQ